MPASVHRARPQREAAFTGRVRLCPDRFPVDRVRRPRVEPLQEQIFEPILGPPLHVFADQGANIIARIAKDALGNAILNIFLERLG